MLKACFALCVLATLYLPDAAVNRQASDPVAAVSQWEASPVPGLGSWLEGLSPAQRIPAQQWWKTTCPAYRLCASVFC